MENERKSLEYQIPEIISRTASEVWDSTDSFSRRRSYIAIVADYYEQDPPPMTHKTTKKRKWWRCCFTPPAS